MRRTFAPALATLALALALAAGLTAGLVLPPAAVAEAADWTIRDVVIDATVNPDGNMAVSETRTFDFPASFRWVEQWIPLSGSQGITGITVREGGPEGPAFVEEGSNGMPPEAPGTFRVTREVDRVAIRFWFAKQAGLRTFTLGYLVESPVVVHNDVAELYWKFIGDQWEVGTGSATVGLHLPPGASREEVRAWGHGPLQGQVTVVDPSLVRLEIAHLPSLTFMEARVTFPVRLVLASQNWSGRDALPGILAEEGRWARQANLRRAAMRADVYATPFILLAAAIYGLWLMARFGREHRPADKPTYYRELPGNYSPAELGVLWNFGNPSPADFVATILDLARRGWIVIEEVRTQRHGLLGIGGGVVRGYRIWQREAPPRGEELLPHEKALLGFVLGPGLSSESPETGPPGTTGRSVLFSEIESYAKRNPIAFRSFYTSWQKEVSLQAKTRRFFDEESKRGRLIAALSGVGIMFTSAGLFFLARTYVSGVAGMVAGAGVLVLTVFLSRRSVEGCNQYWLWRGFRHYLLDFSRLKEAEPPALTLWDHYLVYAVSLGVAKEVIHHLPLVYGQEQVNRSLGTGWFMMAYGGEGLAGAAVGEGLTRSLEGLSSFTSALTTSLQGSISSASGSGGGFSGGGGGGGGGGGRGGGGGGGRAGG